MKCLSMHLQDVLVQMYKRVSTVVYLPSAMRQALPAQRKKSGLQWRKRMRMRI